MKKLIVVTLTFLAGGSAYALPVGNPLDASLLCNGLIWEGDCCTDVWDFFCDPCTSWCDIFSVRVGFYGDYVFNRHLEFDDPQGDDIEHTEIFTNAGYLALNMFNQFDLFATLGATNLFIDTNAGSYNNLELDGRRLEIKTETHFSWSIGTRATLFECGCWGVGLEGQYFRAEPKITRITHSATFSVYPDDISLRYREWQVGLGVSYKINLFVPYIAVKWSWAKASMENREIIFPDEEGASIFLHNLENKKLWGYAVGVSLVDCNQASMTLEGRWGSEKAVYVNGQVRF